MSNPFAALLESKVTFEEEVDETCTVLEDIFKFTLDKGRCVSDNLLYLEDAAATFTNRQLDLEVVEHVLFERLLLSQINQENAFKSTDEHTFESNVVVYLFRCYSKASQNQDADISRAAILLIMRNLLTSFKQPDLYQDQDLVAQFYNIMKSNESNAVDFFKELYQSCLKEEGKSFQWKIEFLRLSTATCHLKVYFVCITIIFLCSVFVRGGD